MKEVDVTYYKFPNESKYSNTLPNNYWQTFALELEEN